MRGSAGRCSWGTCTAAPPCSIWNGGIRYPEVTAEDAMLLQQAIARGLRLQKLDNRGSSVLLAPLEERLAVQHKLARRPDRVAPLGTAEWIFRRVP